MRPEDRHPESRHAGQLTERQQQIWNYLVEYVDGHGYPPTEREIGEQWGSPRPRRCTPTSRTSSARDCCAVTRPTYAALMVAAGAHPKYLQAQMGHSSIRVTLDLYGHLFPDSNRGRSGCPRPAHGPIHTPSEKWLERFVERKSRHERGL
jgi:integrase